ncbi:MAG: TolC family protein [Pirellulales bacterium]
MNRAWSTLIMLLGVLPQVSAAQTLPLRPPANRGELRIVAESQPAAASPSDRLQPVPVTPVAPGAPQPPPAMTLAALEDIATANNPTLVQAAGRVRAAQGAYVQAGLYPNPVLGYRGDEMGNGGTAGQQGGFLSQELVTAGKLRLSQAVVSQEVRQAQHAWEAQRWRVLVDVRRGYYDVLAAQRTLELTEKLMQIGREGVKAADQLLKAKEVSRVDVLQAQIEYQSAAILLDKARNRHLASWRSLASVLGTPEMQPAPLAGTLDDGLPQLTWEGALGRLMSESPELALARAGVDRARWALSRECAGAYPNLDVLGSVRHNADNGDTLAEVELGVPLPLFNRNQGNISKAQAELTVAMNEVRRVELELRNRLATAFEQYANARQQAEKYAVEILPNAQTSLDLVTTGYRQGEFGYLVLLTAQRTHFQTNLAYLDALREMRTTTVTIEGLLLRDSLQPAR